MLNFDFIDIKTFSRLEGKTLDQAKSLLNYYEKNNKLIKVKRGVYLNPKENINRYELSNFIFKKSYISLDNVLFEEGIVKQFPLRVVSSISNNSKTEELFFGDVIFRNFKINIKTNDGLYIGKNKEGRATKERALLDLLYLKFYSKNFYYDNELNLINIDFELLKELAPYYGKRINNFINKNIIGQKKMILN